MRKSRWATTLLCIGLWSQALAASDNPAPGNLRSAGAVTFPVSCNPSVRAEFERGVALLHSFFYEESRRIFTSIAQRDPACAMAQWGIAQTWWHPIWTPPRAEQFTAGKAASERAISLRTRAHTCARSWLCGSQRCRGASRRSTR